MLSLSLLSYGQSATTTTAHSLRLIDADFNEPIVGANLYYPSLQTGTSSNYKGIVEIPAQLPDSAKVNISYIGYKTVNTTAKALRQVSSFKLHSSIEVLNNEAVVLVDRLPITTREASNSITKISAKEIEQQIPSTAANLLERTGQVFVQKSQFGGGSPIIRGFEANKVLLVIDGVRLNNAIYRGGHLQNVITIDPNILQQAEVVFGPASVVYGSDAIGGVMHFSTRTPKFLNPEIADSKTLQAKANAGLRLSSATNEQHTHFNLALSAKKWSSLSSLTYTQFGNLRIGSWRTHDYPDWDVQKYYVSTQNNIDSVHTNSNKNLIKGVGYHQIDALQKVAFKIGSHNQLILNTQYSTSSDIPRTDRLNDTTATGMPKYAKWQYGPQKRWLSSIQWMQQNTPKKIADNASIILAYQNIEEARITRKTYQTSLRTRTENVQVVSANIDANKYLFTSKNSLQYGAEFTHNKVSSKAQVKDITTQQTTTTGVQTRYADGGSAMQTAAAYMRFNYQASKLPWAYSAGIRYSHQFLQASFSDSTIINLPQKEYSENFGALIGSLSATYKNKLSINVGRAFRSPNIDDATKVFDPTDDIVVVPNLKLQPEYAYNAEINYNNYLSYNFRISGAVYYTFLNQLIKRQYTQLNGQDSLLYDGDIKQIYANTNANEAQVIGANLQLLYKWANFEMQNSLTYTQGKDISNNQPLGHIPPLFGQLQINYAPTPNWQLSTWLPYQAIKKAKDYAPTGEDKLNEATPIGTPSWYTINASVTHTYKNKLITTASIENILDKHYKVFASGISAPGRNFRIAIRYHF